MNWVYFDVGRNQDGHFDLMAMGLKCHDGDGPSMIHVLAFPYEFVDLAGEMPLLNCCLAQPRDHFWENLHKNLGIFDSVPRLAAPVLL